MQNIETLKKEVQSRANPAKAKILQRFFKTGSGEYGEGDVFVGLMVPESRKLAKKYANLAFGEIKKLLTSTIHEERLIALLILVEKFNPPPPTHKPRPKIKNAILSERSSGKDSIEENRKKIYDFYLKNVKQVNNWDLVDLSADKIVGAYLLLKKDHSVLKILATSKNVWERRIAIISTYNFIKNNNEFNETLAIAKLLLNDPHDLIHKAVGWMLREVGKRDQKTEETFLQKYYKGMPRTTLRYAIERFPEQKRKKYLTNQI